MLKKTGDAAIALPSHFDPNSIPIFADVELTVLMKNTTIFRHSRMRKKMLRNISAMENHYL